MFNNLGASIVRLLAAAAVLSLLAVACSSPGETAPGETAPGETAPGETAPGETAPGDTAPGETAKPEGDLALVWEAWGRIQQNYPKAGELDPDSVTAGAVDRLLRLSGAAPYPFLTDVGRMRGQTPSAVPAELGDIWRAAAMYRMEHPDFDQSILVEAVLDGILEGLGDPSSTFLNAEDYPRAKKDFEKRLEGSYLGIGTEVVPENGRLFLIPYPDTPAEKAGIERGDILTAVDGHSVEGQTVRSVVDLVGGPEGTKVRLRLLRAGEPDPLELDVFRGNVEIPTVINQLIPGGVGYLRISRFQENTGDQTFEALESMKPYDLLALILDLRFNLGGSPEAASEVAGQFLPPGSLFRYVEDREGVRSQHFIAEDINRLELDDLLLAVLVNDQTAGEAEAVAVALQEAGRAVIVGTGTYGEASNYEFIELSDGSAIYIPTSRWFTPSGEWLGGTGIDPDEYVVSGPENDSQFSRAYEYLNAQLPPFR